MAFEHSINAGSALNEPFSRDPARSADSQLGAVSTLLGSLDAAQPAGPGALDTASLALENRLVQVRLGIAGSLFAALRSKHAPTAHHSLRVALGCAAWGAMMDLSDAQRDELEVAALLHDIGKIGVPEAILLKPSRLSPEEYLIVERHRHTAIDILRGCTASQAILEVVAFAGAWFDGSREGYDLRGEQLPLGARMVSIVDAFDAMTSDQVYRRAMSRERALAELFEFAGTQFDPRLVQEFCNYVNTDQVKLQSGVARRWLKNLQLDESAGGFWQLTSQPSGNGGVDAESLFYRKLLESMHDAVVFVDSSLRIVLWNRAAERLTGVPAASVEHKHWTPTLVSLRDERGKLIEEGDCPLAQAVKTGVQTLKRLSLSGRSNQRLDVDAHLVPVHGKSGVSFGAALLMRDASSQITLEQRIQSLHERATRDPLTQVANRSEFDRILANYVESHLERRLSCSLILCDLDFFKKVNDTYGHQAGDDVLITFAAMLRRHCRSGDLVARYGGEEFVMLCADCDNATATKRAEELRLEIAELPIAAISGKSVSASFGVTEVQSGDTPETMLRRADRALYQAKSGGRNNVVQLGSGIMGEEAPPKQSGWFAWLRPNLPDQVLERTLATGVPFNVLVEKMRGFVADHHASIESVTAQRLVLKIEGELASLMRRTTDRPMPFVVDMRFEECPAAPSGRGSGKVMRTLIHVTIRPQRSRDRRRRDVLERAQRLNASIKSYLIAQDHDANATTAAPPAETAGTAAS